MSRLKRLWLWFLARFHLSDYAVCEMSKGLGPHECYHDYRDDAWPIPLHFVEMACVRCGKRFYI